MRKLFVLCSMLLLLSACQKEDSPIPPPQPETGTEAVLKFFKEINAVPRPSKHEDKIRDYLSAFAAERNLRCINNNGNIIINKPIGRNTTCTSRPSIYCNTAIFYKCT